MISGQQNAWADGCLHRPQESSTAPEDHADLLLPGRAMTRLELFGTWFSGALILLATIVLAVMFVG
jgi:hypothetical protein